MLPAMILSDDETAKSLKFQVKGSLQCGSFMGLKIM